MNDLQKMKELIKKINEADKAYFVDDAPIMSDREYDGLMLELKMLERTTGVRFANSPTGKVASDEKAGLKTVEHSKPMLSCQKTKEVRDIIEFAGEREVVLSWKMDGLTLVLRYENGKFKQAITRGSEGIVGEDVTHTVKHFRNIPMYIPCKDSFEVRGEGVVSWDDHNLLTRLQSSTSHPRSVASGAVRSIEADVGKLSHLDFFAFELIKDDAPKSKMEQLEFLEKNNFDVVEHKLVEESSEIERVIEEFCPSGFKYPVDGIVAEYEDLEYGKSLGATAHHERRMMALKWRDEVKETYFRGVELKTTRTGVVSIVGKFDEVLIDGTRVHRASLHNLSNFEKYSFGIGDLIRVYKANMIIPQIAENLTRSGTYKLPKHCPCCGTELTVKVSPSGIRDLYCPNEECIARHAKKIARFCDKNAMNINGLSASVIENMMAYGWVQSFKDLYHLDLYRDEIISRPGFGADRYHSIMEEIERSRYCHMYQFLIGIGIPNLGNEAAKTLHQYYYGSFEKFEKAVAEDFRFSRIEGISDVVDRSIHAWFADKKNIRMINALKTEVEFIDKTDIIKEKDNPFLDTTVVVTGTFESFSREGIVSLLTALGAKVEDHVTENTDYLIYGVVPGGKKISFAIKYGVNMLSEKGFGEILGTDK